VKNEALCLGPVSNFFWINDKALSNCGYSLKNRIVSTNKNSHDFGLQKVTTFVWHSTLVADNLWYLSKWRSFWRPLFNCSKRLVWIRHCIDWPLNFCVRIRSYKRYVWWLHIAKLTLETVKKTWNCFIYAQNTAGTDKKRRYRPAVFNGSEIAPLGRLNVLRGRFCDLPDLGGDFSFHWGDFCRLEYTEILNWFQK